MNEQILSFLIYAATFAAFGGLGYLLCPKNPDEMMGILHQEKGRKSGLLLLLSPFMIPLGRAIAAIPASSLKKYLKKIERMLVSADLEAGLKAQEFAALQLIVPLTLIPFLVLCSLKTEAFPFLREWGPAFLIYFAVLAFGFMLPLISLKDKVSRRQKTISRELPFALDMLTSAVQAGLDFSGAIRRFIQKAVKITPLKSELSLMLKEISLGKTRSEALRRMGERVDLKELTQVINALIQADQLGTSLATVLTNLSDDLRVKRFQLAEKLALEAPVKMLFPLVAFIFPAVFIILIGPLVIQMVTELGKR